MFRAFGLPARFVYLGSATLPILEITAALLLVPTATVSLGATLAVGLLGTITSALVVNLARGRHPHCHCFGQRDSRPIRLRSVVANLTLLGCGVALLGLGREHAPVSSDLVASYAQVAQLLAAPVVISWLVFRAQIRDLHGGGTEEPSLALVPNEDARGLPLGIMAPAFTAQTLQGRTVTLADLLSRRRPLLLVFSNAAYPSCADLHTFVSYWHARHIGTLTVAMICTGNVEEVRTNLKSFPGENVLLQGTNEIAKAYRCFAMPSGVLVASDGRISSWPTIGTPGISWLIAKNEMYAVLRGIASRYRAAN